MGAFIGWLIGSILSLIVVQAIPGDQGLWAFIIGFTFSMTGIIVGRALEEANK